MILYKKFIRTDQEYKSIMLNDAGHPTLNIIKKFLNKF